MSTPRSWAASSCASATQCSMDPCDGGWRRSDRECSGRANRIWLRAAEVWEKHKDFRGRTGRDRRAFEVAFISRYEKSCSDLETSGCLYGILVDFEPQREGALKVRCFERNDINDVE